MLLFMAKGLNSVEVGQRLWQTRIALGQPNASKFASKAGIGQSLYSMYETGDRLLSITAVVRICLEYGVTLDWLYRGVTTLLPNGIVENLPEIDKVLSKRPKGGHDHSISPQQRAKTAAKRAVILGLSSLSALSSAL